MMSRDHRKLEVFRLADDLVAPTYRATRMFPSSEHFGLQSQIRRAAVSAVTNILEGCSRDSPREFLRFLQVALGSASEVAYLLELARRLGFLDQEGGEPVARGYTGLVRALQKFITGFRPFL